MLSFATTLVLGPLAGPTSAAGSITGFTVDSQPGDWVGNGSSFALTPSNATVAFDGAPNGVYMMAYNFDHSWQALIAAPLGQNLQTKTYSTARHPSDSMAGLDVFGDGHGCNTSNGTLIVLEIMLDGDGKVTQFAARYEQHCEGKTPALFGELRFGSTVDFVAASNEPRAVDFGDQFVGTPSSAQSITVSNVGSASLSLGVAGISGTNSDDFAITSNACSGSSLTPGDSCALEVVFTPGATGIRSAVLHLDDNTLRGGRDVLLSGNGFKFASSLSLAGSASTVNYKQLVTVTAHLGPHGSNDVVSIYMTPYGGTKTLVKSDHVDPAGDLSATVTMLKNSSFVAEFDGDSEYGAASSNEVVVSVRVNIKGTLSKFYGSRGKYRLYHYTSSCPNLGKGCPTYTAAVAPNHRGKRVYFVLQVYIGSRWRTALSFSARLNSVSKRTVIFVYTSRDVINVPTRVHVYFKKDADHLGRISGWSYFKITR